VTSSAPRWAVLLGATVLAVAGCSGDAEPEASPTASASASASSADPTPTPTPTPTEDVEAQVLRSYDAYWAATVAAQRGNPDPALFNGNTADEQRELELQIARDYQASGITREGAPTISGQDVEVTGDQAVVFACVDHSTWLVPQAGGDRIGVVPTTVRVERVAQTWLVTEFVESEADRTC